MRLERPRCPCGARTPPRILVPLYDGSSMSRVIDLNRKTTWKDWAVLLLKALFVILLLWGGLLLLLFVMTGGGAIV